MSSNPNDDLLARDEAVQAEFWRHVDASPRLTAAVVVATYVVLAVLPIAAIAALFWWLV